MSVFNKIYLFEFTDAEKSQITLSALEHGINKEFQNENFDYNKQNGFTEERVEYKKCIEAKAVDAHKQNFESSKQNSKSKGHKTRNFIIVGAIVFAIIAMISNIDDSTNSTVPEKISSAEEEMNFQETITLKEMRPSMKSDGDAFFFEDKIIGANGITMLDVVHPGSTGTVKSTGGGGAHPAQGFNRVYQNEGYANFSGILFISEDYANYTKHVLTLLFEVYGDGKLLYEAPKWQTGNSYNMLPFDIDISSYSEIRIHFEAINDSNLFSWDECTFGISEPTFSKLSIGEQKTTG